jgi:hypothetical protein
MGRMRRLLPYVAVVLVYLMTPLAGEITENVVHLLAEGHAAHAIEDDAHTPEGPEHGCSGPFHMCSCHSSAAFTQTASSIHVRAAFPGKTEDGWWYEDAPSDVHRDGVFRPPIA